MTQGRTDWSIPIIIVVAVVVFGGMYWFHTNYRCTSTHIEQQTTCDTDTSTTGSTSTKSRRTTNCRTRPVEVCDNWESR